VKTRSLTTGKLHGLLKVIGPPNESCSGGVAAAGEEETPSAMVAASSESSFKVSPPLRVDPGSVDQFSQYALAIGWQSA
jgi:hypothetical protein